jgi:DNA/RNA-binding domain of Phe-tRNA-synthetase-like protein
MPGRSEQQLAPHPLVRAYRHLARQLGLQLTPAVEGLYRRGILRGRFPAISPLVDTANVLAAERLIPIGVFDRARIQGAVELTLSTPAASFVPIGQDEPVTVIGHPSWFVIGGPNGRRSTGWEVLRRSIPAIR